MASLDDLKKRIVSVKSTQKITKAMKMVAAAKLKRAQENAEKGRPYSEKMNNIILNLSSGISDKENAPKLLSGTGDDKIHLCVVLTSDRGLCGGFNTNIIKPPNRIRLFFCLLCIFRVYFKTLKPFENRLFFSLCGLFGTETRGRNLYARASYHLTSSCLLCRRRKRERF